MGKAHRPWKELEGQRLRIDVGSTKEEALASQNDSTIFFTKDRSIVMNGCVFSDAQTQQPVRVNVCRAIPTRPRKGQIYFFEHRITYRIKRRLMKEGETLNIPSHIIGMTERSASYISEWEPPITKDNWPGEEYISILAVEQRNGGWFVKVEKDGFVGDEGVLSFHRASKFISQQLVPTSPNFAFRRDPQYYDNGISAEPHLSVKCIAEPPARAITLDDFKKYAQFLITRKRHRYLLEANGGAQVKRLPITREVAEVSLCRTDTWAKKKFFVLARIRRRKVSEKKVFVRRVDSLDFPGTYFYAVEPLRER